MRQIKGEVTIGLIDYHYLVSCEKQMEQMKKLMMKCVTGCNVGKIPEKDWKYYPDNVVIEMVPEMEQAIRHLLENDAY